MAASRVYCPPEEFTFRLRQRLPMNVGFTFTNEQLEALRNAFGDRFDRRHSIDMRGRVHLPWSSYYLVFQMGRDRRTDARRSLVTQRARIAFDSVVCGMAALGLVSGLMLVGLHLLH